jgi:excinuclease ABC subunit A
MNQDQTLNNLNPKEHIIIKGARVHNLKNIDVVIPRNKLVVITGLSGSGKSSLAFNTLYAEGQRRYVESLSSYARQFLGKVEKPEVDYIKGISPAIAIEQKVNSTNSRSTVGTITEIYDYLKLLYARVGKTISPESGKEIKSDSVQDVVDAILKLEAGFKVFLTARIKLNAKKDFNEQIQLFIQQGFSRAYQNGESVYLEDLKESDTKSELNLMIDRFISGSQLEEEEARITDSVETAFYEGKNKCELQLQDKDGKIETKLFSNAFEEQNVKYIEPSVHLFSFNNPIGACPKCEGFGKVIGIDEDLVIPNKSLSVYQDAIACWKGDKMQVWKNDLIRNAEKFDFPIHKPIYDLNEQQYTLLWEGNQYFAGLNEFFDYLSRKTYKIHYRVMLARYRGRTRCPNCQGKRLRKEATYVKINDRSITDLVNLSVKDLKTFMGNLKLNEHERKIAKRLLIEIESRLDYLLKVGVSYLSLNRSANTLSGGESQRINLATSLGSSLVGSMYILDEPSIGLHPQDTKRLIEVLRGLQQAGNTVIVVEHDEEIMRAADYIIDMGPEAGYLGGEVVYSGNMKGILKTKTLTAQYLNGNEQVNPEKTERKWNNQIVIKGARENNLKGIDVSFPLHAMSVVCGLSGSGKSSLINQVLYPALQKHLGQYGEKSGLFESLEGNLTKIQAVEFIDQNPIGKSSRSNPVIYIKAYDEIRNLFASQGLAKKRGYKAAHFSFNVSGGRCEECKGEGEIIEAMQFMADIHLVCEECGGKRFKEEILEIKFHGQNIADILEMTVDEAIKFYLEYENDKQAVKVAERLSPLQEVGLGYVKLGQASSTLSGGEAQRIKLASYLGKGGTSKHTIFIFDEPTTGLHFHDIAKLLKSFDALIESGHSLIVIEHNPEVIKHADWVIELGPKGGDEGGKLLFQGKQDAFRTNKASVTNSFVK